MSFRVWLPIKFYSLGSFDFVLYLFYFILLYSVKFEKYLIKKVCEFSFYLHILYVYDQIKLQLFEKKIVV